MRLPTPAEIGDFESEGIFTVRHGINAVCSHVDGEIFSVNYGEFSTWVEDSPDSKKEQGMVLTVPFESHENSD